MGLVQCELEAAGFVTLSLSMIPELTASTGAPRIAAVEHPFGAPMGLPGDAVHQGAVLLAALQALARIAQPGTTVHLPFEWNGPPKPLIYPPETPPIAQYLRRRPWLLPKFLNRTPPAPPPV